MKVELVVVHPFGEYAKGTWIGDQKLVAEILESHPTHVNKVAAKPDSPVSPAK